MTKIAVVTGASKGIGAATAIAFAKEGYDVVVNFLSDNAAAAKVVKEIEGAGQKALLVQADVLTEAGVGQLFYAVDKAHGRIDVLVNSVGMPQEPQFGEWSHETIVQSLTGNVVSAALCAQAAVPLMKDGGNILFCTSIYGLNFGGSPRLPLYSAGKAAIISLTQTLAEKLAPRIRCNVVAPGTTKTPAWDGASPDYVAVSLGMTLQKEWVEPEEIAETFVFLTKVPHINAQTIVVDAGWQKKIRDDRVADKG